MTLTSRDLAVQRDSGEQSSLRLVGLRRRHYARHECVLVQIGHSQCNTRKVDREQLTRLVGFGVASRSIAAKIGSASAFSGGGLGTRAGGSCGTHLIEPWPLVSEVWVGQIRLLVGDRLEDQCSIGSELAILEILGRDGRRFLAPDAR